MLAVGASVASLAWFGFHAVQEWRRSAAQLIERIADDRAELLATALRRDMRGAQSFVLANQDSGDYGTQSLPDFSDQVAAAFARYPYPESFFGWRQGEPTGLVFFARANRESPWPPSRAVAGNFPVIVEHRPALADQLLARIRPLASEGRGYAIFETNLAGFPYQVIAHLRYSGPLREQLQSMTGFMVNLAWVRQNYFSEIVSQVARIGESAAVLDYGVTDEHNRPVTGNAMPGKGAVRTFPLEFFDSSISAADIHMPDSGAWHVQVSATRDPSLIWATRGGNWTTVVIAAISLALATSVFLVGHAAWTSASVAALRADFVSTVTHELKTPLATIRAVGDTLMRGSLTREGVSEYASLLVQESKRLTRLVDNLLAYSRVSDVTEAYSFEGIEPAELIEDCLRTFRRQLMDDTFEVVAEVDPHVPLVRGDRVALELALDNLIDNAIRYSGEHRSIRIGASHNDAGISFEVRDRGNGIPTEEIGIVQRKFVRGRAAGSMAGSGLGLSIVQRIAADHGGRFELESTVGIGTTARLTIPMYHA
jgi:two-component system phosphate regulon sensor histidine kinase PhoR